jgi:trk system potassium uptake protein TrkA
VVAIGAQSMEASILTTALLRQMGCRASSRARWSELHAQVLRAVAPRGGQPRGGDGPSAGRRLYEPNVLERLELGEDAELVELAAPESFIGKTLVDLQVRQQFGVTVVAVRRAGMVRASIGTGDRLEPGDVLVVIGDPEGASRLAALA